VDKYGFAALPGGFGDPDGDRNFGGSGSVGKWHSATRNNITNDPVAWSMIYDEEFVFRISNDMRHFYSVRCVQD